MICQVLPMKKRYYEDDLWWWPQRGFPRNDMQRMKLNKVAVVIISLVNIYFATLAAVASNLPMACKIYYTTPQSFSEHF